MRSGIFQSGRQGCAIILEDSKIAHIAAEPLQHGGHHETIGIEELRRAASGGVDERLAIEGDGGGAQPRGGRHAQRDVAGAARELTERHAEAVAVLLADAGLAPTDIGVVGFHGQTILHGDGRKWTAVAAGLPATRPPRELIGGGTITPGNDLQGVWSSAGTTWVVGGPEFPNEGFILREGFILNEGVIVREGFILNEGFIVRETTGDPSGTSDRSFFGD